MGSMIHPGLPPAALAALKESLGCLVVGTVFSTGVYGITILQAYIYFRNNGQDSAYMRYFVTLLFILDTVSMILNVDGLYEYVVTDFGNPLQLLQIPATLAFENGVTVLIGTLTQCFFAHRLWALSDRHVMLTSSIVILALCSCGPGIAISVHLYTNNNVLSLGSVEIRVLAGFANGLSVICDVLIAAALTYYLNSKRTGFKRTNSIINRLIIIAVNRGALTAICQACHMITTIAFPGRFIFLPFALLDGKLYCNTLLATLNAQKSMRGDENNAVELGMHILNPMNASTSGNGKQQITTRPSVTESSSSGNMSAFLPTGKAHCRASESTEQPQQRHLGGDGLVPVLCAQSEEPRSA
ncbi:hypothetical protein LXA43DRAFT_1131211 [Ganoderma leucocontextum]|nr:hypothetical protein LXA43DRAFT_1131211 [Ganoderma leucocontextum]